MVDADSTALLQAELEARRDGTSTASGAGRRYRMTLRDQSDLPEVPGNETPPESPEDDGDWPTDELADAPLRMPGENPDVETEL